MQINVRSITVKKTKNMIWWILAAVGSAFFAGVTAVLSKCGVKNSDSDVATAVRTSVVLVFAWLVVIITGAYDGIGSVTAESWLFLTLSGLATAASWICYFKALSLGPVGKVAAVDKSGVVLSVLLSIILFADERKNWWVKLLYLVAIAAGTYLMLDIKKSSKNANVSKNCDTTEASDGQNEQQPPLPELPSVDNTTTQKQHPLWLLFALLSAVFAAATSLLAKIGIRNVDSNLATALRTCVVFVAAWVIVPCRGKSKFVKQLPKRDLLFLVLSGIATGASWLCYYYALQQGQVSIVVPIDKMSILVTVLFGTFVLHEKQSWRTWTGLGLLTVGTLCMAIFG